MTLETVEEKVDKILEQFTETLELDPDLFMSGYEMTWMFYLNSRNLPGLPIKIRVEDRGFEGKFLVLTIDDPIQRYHMTTRRWKLIRP